MERYQCITRRSNVGQVIGFLLRERKKNSSLKKVMRVARSPTRRRVSSGRAEILNRSEKVGTALTMRASGGTGKSLNAASGCKIEFKVAGTADDYLLSKTFAAERADRWPVFFFFEVSVIQNLFNFIRTDSLKRKLLINITIFICATDSFIAAFFYLKIHRLKFLIS